MNDLLGQIKEQLNVFAVNATAQASNGNKAAGARSRKASLELTKLFKEWRKLSVENKQN